MAPEEPYAVVPKKHKDQTAKVKALNVTKSGEQQIAVHEVRLPPHTILQRGPDTIPEQGDVM